MSPLPFFSGWVRLKVSQFYLFKEPAFRLTDFCYCFLGFYFIYFCLIFMIYFLLLTLGFVCSSFSSCFRYRNRLFETFLFLEVRLYCYKLPLELLWLQPIGFRSLFILFVSRYHSLTPYIKISSKWVKDIDVRLGTTKFLEKNTEHFLDIYQRNICLDPSPRVLEIKTKINIWDLIKIKNLHNKGNHKQMKKTIYGMGKKCYSYTIKKGLISKIY